MTAPADGIKDLLVAAGVGIFAAADGWSICIGKTVDLPDTLICCRQTGGQTPNPKWLLDYPSVQVIVRGNANGYADAFTKATAVKDVLLGLPSQDLNGDRWVQINGLGDIVDIGVDEKKRPRLAVNFSLILEPAASALTNRQPL